MSTIKFNGVLLGLLMSSSVQAHDSFQALSQTHGHLSGYFGALFHPWFEKMANPSGLMTLAVLNLLALIILVRIRQSYAVSFSNR